MPVTVKVPTKIRIDREAALDRPDWIEEAATRAIRRALAKSRREVLDRRGGYVGVELHPPQFTWSGDDHAGVPDPVRRALERRLAAAIRDAAEAAGIGEARLGSAPPVIPPDPSETLVASRKNAQLNYYRVPSYDSPPGVTTIDFEDEGPIEVPSPNSFEWRQISEAEMAAHLKENIAEIVRQWGALPAGVPQGIVFQKGPGDFMVVIFTSPKLSYFGFGGFGHYEYQPGKVPPFKLVTTPATPDRATAVRTILITPGRPGLIDVLDSEFGNAIESQIRAGNPAEEDMLPEEHNVQVAGAVSAEIERRADQMMEQLKGRIPTSVVKVEMGGNYVVLVGTAEDDVNLHWTGSANLLPFTRQLSAKSGGDGKSGGGGNKGSGEHGGDGGSQEGGTEGSGGPGAGGSGGRGSGPPHRGGFVFAPGLTREEPGVGVVYPSFRLGGATLECEPFEGEPKLDEMGPEKEILRVLIDDIAHRLDMADPCVYPAQFCYHAARQILRRAMDIGTYVGALEPGGFTLPVPEGTGNMGAIQFHPVASPAIQFMRHLSGVVPRLHGLMRRIMQVYEQPPYRDKILAAGASNMSSWELHFLEMMTPAVEEAVGHIFLVTCQSMLLQLLQASRHGIDSRIAKFNEYAPIFEKLMQTQLSDYTELAALKSRLQMHTRVGTAIEVATGVGPAAAANADPAVGWFMAAQGMTGFLSLVESSKVVQGGQDEFVEQDGVTRIRDDHGTLWSISDLEQAMVMQRGAAESIDPLVKQISDIPDVMTRFRANRSAIRDTLWSVLNEMSNNNREMLGKTRDDLWFAFKASSINENVETATIPGTNYNLGGIHLRAHEQIGYFFQGDSYYGLGVDVLFASYQGKEELIGFGINIGIIALSVLCPPAGFIAGVAVASKEVADAREKARLYESMLDPELVISKAEVEIGLFVAYLGFAMSLIPEAGTIAGTLERGVKVGLRAGLKAGVRAAGKYAVRKITQQIIEAAAKSALEAFVRDVITNVVMDKVIQKVMEPILAHIEHEVMVEQAVGGLQGARFIIEVLNHEEGSR